MISFSRTGGWDYEFVERLLLANHMKNGVCLRIYLPEKFELLQLQIELRADLIDPQFILLSILDVYILLQFFHWKVCFMVRSFFYWVSYTLSINKMSACRARTNLELTC